MAKSKDIKAGKKKSGSWIKRLFVGSLVLGFLGVVGVVGVVTWAILHYGRDLPDYRFLAAYEPAVTTRVYAGDGSLLEEFAREPRLFVPIEVIPDRVKNAFLSAEDRKFYDHDGLDYLGMVRAGGRTALSLLKGQRRLQGASTITQQVARNILLTLDQKFDRKIKEMILSLRIERALSKDRILELYLNEINFGNRSYGIAAAAQNYFDKSLDELTLAETAYLAALPKGPNNYHPVRNKERAVARRNWVLSRMHALEFIDDSAYQVALAEDLVMRSRTNDAPYRADYYAEEVRRQLKTEFGEKALYEGGLFVRTSLEPRLQAIAEKALKDGLIAYDRRHGWRGPIKRMAVADSWAQDLKKQRVPVGYPTWRKALVHEVRADGAVIGFDDGGYGFIALEELKWARPWRRGEWLGPKVEDPATVLRLGDIIAVAPLVADAYSLDDYFDDAGEPLGATPRYSLQQIPAISGALVALDPHTGRVLALVGGFDFNVSQFNRATQARRQPGSAIKPFVYAAALERDFTPASLVLDAPFVIDQGQGLGKWKPRNSSNKVYGPSTLRLGIEKSRNLMTVRLAQYLGMDRIVRTARRFGIAENMEPTLAGSLGAGEVTPLQMTAAYAMLVNGGREVKPSLIDRIQDRRGRTIMRHEERDCRACSVPPIGAEYIEPSLPDQRRQVLDEVTSYQVVSMLEGVVQRGTGRKIRAVGKPLAGKTGTTNDATDAWFVGFAPDLAVGVFTGFDRPRSLGQYEEGSSVAAPIFKDFMAEALADQPGVPFRTPSGVRFVRIDFDTGQPATRTSKTVIMEAFKPGTEPKRGQVAVLDGTTVGGAQPQTSRPGGIY